MNNKGIPLVIGLCCIYPILFYMVVEWLRRVISNRDWSNIQWSEFRWPWSKDK